MGSELRANYKCSLLSCQEQCPVLLERAETIPCHPDPSAREQIVYCCGGFVVLPALRGGAPREKPSASVPGVSSLSWDPQGKLSPVYLISLIGAVGGSKGLLKPSSSVIIYYAVNFNLSFRTGIVDCKQSSSSSPHIFQVAWKEQICLDC